MALGLGNLRFAKKQAQILRAEALRQSSVLEAEGHQQATIKIAQGDAEATKLRNQALTTYFKDTAITFKELETIATALENNAKIIVPQGNMISLILNELESARKIIPVPIAQKSEKTSNSS